MQEKLLTFKQYKEIQDLLNERTVDNWKMNLTINQFKVAMFDEFAELLNSASFKWWKHSDKPADLWNLKIEAIDVFHFALSIYILKRSTTYDECLVGEHNTEHNYMLDNTGMIDHNVFISKTLKVLSSDNLVDMEDLFDSLGMTPIEITAIYVAKSELNYIRQENGYKTGAYVKVVDGVEDNQRMEECVNHFINDPDCGIDDLRKHVREMFFLHANEDPNLEML